MRLCLLFMVANLLLANIAEARTTFLPDYMGGEVGFNNFDDDVNINYDEPMCAEAGIYHKASGCPTPKIFDEYCPFDDEWISECYCPSVFSKKCNSPYRGDTRIKDKRTGYSNCDDLWVACCDATCPRNTTRENPGGCGGSTTNACGDTCYYPYEPCCTPLADETGCEYGTITCSDGCDGKRTCCKSCTPKKDETDCANGTTTCSDGCGGTRKCCAACTPLKDATGCIFGTGSCSDGCGGTRQCCCDENDRSCACPGYVYCEPTTKVGDGATCTDGVKTYYERCLVKETCNDEKYDEKDGYCLTYSFNGSYYVKDKCTTQTGRVYKYYSSCVGYSGNSYKDCAGNIAPCKGMKRCEGDKGIGTACECGGDKFYQECQEGICNTDSMYTNGTNTKNGYCIATASKSLKDKTGYYYVKDKCTKDDGTVIFGVRACNDTSKDCNGNYPKCKGKKTCPNNEGTGLCECGGQKYFDECSENCTTGGKSFNGVYHNAVKENTSYFTSGYYKVSLKCTMTDNTKVYYIASCVADSKDANGNYAPCKDKQTCSSEYIGIGEKCECGGKTYYEACAFICNYEDTEESCKALGKSFEQKCYGVNSSKVQKWYGVCK